MENQITVRQLLKKDQRRISAMLAKLMDQIDDKSIAHIISSAAGSSSGGDTEADDAQRKASITKVFMELFKRLLASLQDEATALLADLIGVTPEQYEEMPIDIDVQILEQLKARPEVENFFTGALRLYSSTAWFRTTFENLKGRYASASAAVQENLTK